jgi:hypothetical protein
MLNRTQLVESIAGLIKNGINMDGYNLFECNLFLKELNDFINTETSLSSYYKNRKVTIESIFFDPLLSVELEKTTIQCIPITDEGWLDAVFEVVKFMHVRAAKRREEEAKKRKNEDEDNKQFDWL